MTKQPTTSTTTTSTTTTPPIVVATVEAVEAVRNVVPPARDARLPKEAVNLHNGVIPSPLGRSSDGNDVARLGHAEVSEGLSQEVTPADEQSPSKKRKKKSKRAKTKPEAKNRELRSSSTLGRSSHGDDVPKRGHSEVSEVPVQELVPVKEQTSSVQHHENLTQSESLNSKSSPDKKTKGKDRRRPKIFKKIKKRLKRFGKNTRKKFEKKLSTILVLSLLLFFFPHLSNNTIDSGVPQDLQRQGQVTNVMICPPLESASPVAVTPNQSVSKTANTHMQVNQACYVAQQ